MRLALPASSKRHPSGIAPDSGFYRQGIWMVSATVIGNLFSFGTNLVAAWMSMAEYGLMATLLASATMMMIPAMGLQAVFAMEAAGSETREETDELAQNATAALLFTGLVWLAFVALAFHFREDIYRRLNMPHPGALWVTVCLGLLQLWLPIEVGLLQGRQNFQWLGWALI